MIAKTLLATMAIIMLMGSATSTDTEYDVAKYCRLVKLGTKLPSMISCQTYYNCQGNAQPIRATCTGNTAFSKNDQACIPLEQSKCVTGVKNPCENRHREYVQSSKGCNWWNYCLNGVVAGDGTCNLGLIFSSENGSCVYGNCENSIDNAGVQNSCQVMPDGVYFGDFKDCTAWYKCQTMMKTSGHCQNSLVFDTVRAMCLVNDGNMCQRTDNVVQSQASGPPKEDCKSADQVAADANVCSIYYVCKRAPNTPGNVFEWVESHCQNQYYDVMSQQCTSTSLARVFPGCDRCQFKRGNPYWANDVDENCSKYFICNNGRKVGTSPNSCGLGNFFNEITQTCVIGDYTLHSYATNHGACQNYTCKQDDRVCSLAGEGTDKPTGTDKPNGSDKPNETDKPTGTDKPNETTSAAKPDEQQAA